MPDFEIVGCRFDSVEKTNNFADATLQFLRTIDDKENVNSVFDAKERVMTNFETVLRHIHQGSTYSWDLTVLLGLGIAVSGSLREKLLQSSTTVDEEALITSIYTRKLLNHWRG